MKFSKIAVLGLGKVGKLAARLLHDSGFEVTGYDTRTPREELPFDIARADLSDTQDLSR
ncbi:MAG TPA: L-lysine dehydrogenase, partial [Devosia sp.]|nr:L-lysine dehydrogenase [Devosia sp.]